MERVQEILKEYNNKDHPYQLSLSYGASYFDSGNIDAFMKEMDDNMYKMKERHHE